MTKKYKMRIRRSITGIAGLFLLGSTVMTGCAKSDNPVGAEEGNPLAVRLSAGLQATTKAAVNTGTLFTAAVAGWQNTGAVDYGRTRTWLTSATVTAAPKRLRKSPWPKNNTIARTGRRRPISGRGILRAL